MSKVGGLEKRRRHVKPRERRGKGIRGRRVCFCIGNEGRRGLSAVSEDKFNGLGIKAVDRI